MVRLRLDLTRPVSHELPRECVDLAVQAPTGRNRQRSHFVVVTDAERERALADVWRAGMNGPIDAAEAALTDRGLGTGWTGGNLRREREAAEVLGIPYTEVMQAALIPVAHTVGTGFRPARRIPTSEVPHWDRW